MSVSAHVQCKADIPLPKLVKEAHRNAVGLETDFCELLESPHFLQGEIAEQAELREVQAHKVT